MYKLPYPVPFLSPPPSRCLEVSLISIVALPLRPTAVAAALAPLALVFGAVAKGHGAVAMWDTGGREVAWL